MVTYIIIFLQVFLRCVERISILHGKLTHTDQTGSRSCLITEFSLKLIDHKWIFVVGLSILTNKLYSSFLMCHSKNQLGIVTVSQTYELTSDALITTGLFPQICRHNNRE